MTQTNISKLPLFTVIAVLLLLGLTGCAKDQKPMKSVNDHFIDDEQPRSVNAFFNQQHANAARQDGMLYPAHFDGTALNSLGRQKLDLMFAGAERGMVQVYLKVAKDNAYRDREAAVNSYLTSKNIKSEEYALNFGDNPGVGASASDGLKGIEKQEAFAEGEGESLAGSTGGSK
jgi:hypothetical protein